MKTSTLVLLIGGLAAAGSGTWLFIAQPWEPGAARPVRVPAAADPADAAPVGSVTASHTARLFDEFRAPTRVLARQDDDAFGDRILPIGWATPSKFAFRKISINGGCGVGSDEVLVQDVMTDRIISRTAFCQRPCEPCEEDLAGHDGNFSWRRHQAAITRAMERFGITPLADIPIYERAEVRGEDGSLVRFKLDVSTLRPADPDNEEWDPQVAYKLIAMVVGSSKVIHQGPHTGGVELAGFVRDPYRDEVMVLLELTSHGFEYEEVMERIFVGCQLDPSYLQ